MSRPYGITVPFDDVPLADHRSWYARLAELGYTDAWSFEVAGTDGFTPLALAAAWEPRLHLGTAIIPVFTRGRALLAQSAAALAEAAPGRFSLGVGTSSPIIVEQWNAVSFADPLPRVRETLRYLRAVLGGEKVDGFRLSRSLPEPPPLLLAALRPKMLRLAGEEADGVVLNWLAPEDVPTALREVGATGEVVCRIFVVPTDDLELARAIGRRLLTAYLTVPAYADFHRWLGRGPALEPMWKAWAEGDRRGALAAIPDEVVDALVVHGSPEACRDRIDAYVASGVTLPVLAPTTTAADLDRVLGDLAPRNEPGED